MDTDAVTTADDPKKERTKFIYMHKKNDLDLYYRKKRSIDFSDSKDSSTWQSHLHGFDVQIGFKRIRWFPPRIPEHPSVLISKDTARNKAIDIRYRHIPEAYMDDVIQQMRQLLTLATLIEPIASAVAERPSKRCYTTNQAMRTVC